MLLCTFWRNSAPKVPRFSFFVNRGKTRPCTTFRVRFSNSAGLVCLGKFKLKINLDFEEGMYGVSESGLAGKWSKVKRVKVKVSRVNLGELGLATHIFSYPQIALRGRTGTCLFSGRCKSRVNGASELGLATNSFSYPQIAVREQRTDWDLSFFRCKILDKFLYPQIDLDINVD